MSYSFNNPCYCCQKSKEGCEDSKKIQDAIYSIHTSTDGSHQGSGAVQMMCVKINSTVK